MAYHRDHPDEQTGREIVRAGSLPRERKLELCAQCHSGRGELLQPAFSYRPGEPLSAHLELDLDSERVQGGVHGNQYPRLRRARCFQKSQTLTCIDCHDSHMSESGQIALFSKRCQNCHAPDRCGLFTKVGASLVTNCIDCHMPVRADPFVTFSSAGVNRGTPVRMRDHRIGIYPVESRRILDEASASRVSTR